MVGGEVRVGGVCDADEHACGNEPAIASTEATAYKTQIKKHEMNADEARKYFLGGGRPKCRGC